MSKKTQPLTESTHSSCLEFEHSKDFAEAKDHLMQPASYVFTIDCGGVR
jgi:hypothetical protein